MNVVGEIAHLVESCPGRHATTAEHAAWLTRKADLLDRIAEADDADGNPAAAAEARVLAVQARLDADHAADFAEPITVTEQPPGFTPDYFTPDYTGLDEDLGPDAAWP